VNPEGRIRERHASSNQPMARVTSGNPDFRGRWWPDLIGRSACLVDEQTEGKPRQRCPHIFA